MGGETPTHLTLTFYKEKVMAKTIYENGEWVPAQTHHIIPIHAGGTDDPENLIDLSLPNHIKAHKDRYEEIGDWQDRIAYQWMSGMIGKEEAIRQIQSEGGKIACKNPNFIEAARQANIGNTYFSGKTHSDLTKQKMHDAKIGMYDGEKNPMFGKHHPKERRERIGDTLRGRPGLSGPDHPCYGTHLSLEHRAAISIGNTGKKHTDEAKENMAKSQEKFLYLVTFPDGKEVIITNLSKFCREHNLAVSNMCNISNNVPNFKTCKGFKVRKIGILPKP